MAYPLAEIGEIKAGKDIETFPGTVLEAENILLRGGN